MKYVDTGQRNPKETVAGWMEDAVSKGISEFRCQSGYFTFEGVSILLPALKKCVDDGSILRLVLGSNGGCTLASHISYLAGALALPQQSVSLGVVTFENGLFHPKVYHIVRADGSQTAYVGSANLTGPGVSGLNIEAGVILDTEKGDDVLVLSDISERIESWFEGAPLGVFEIKSLGDIDELLSVGRLSLSPPPEINNEDGDGGSNKKSGKRGLDRLNSIYQLPKQHTDYTSALREVKSGLDAAQRRLLARHTEASFHYPQGTHLGHLLAILWYFSQDRSGTAFDDEYIRLSGSLGSGRLAGYRRQIKYKILAAIELGLMVDIRLEPDDTKYVPSLTVKGAELWSRLREYVSEEELLFSTDDEGLFSTVTPCPPQHYNEVLISAQRKSQELAREYRGLVFRMPAVRQMLIFIYHNFECRKIRKSEIYENFFKSPHVVRFCDEMGIEPATFEAAKRRCPFILSLLESCEILSQDQRSITINTFVLGEEFLSPDGVREINADVEVRTIVDEWGHDTSTLPRDRIKQLRALFGASFLTSDFHFSKILEIET